jgi:small-conductance mechanosensitive channel
MLSRLASQLARVPLEGAAIMAFRVPLNTPQLVAQTVGRNIIPLALGTGLALGVTARAWMRLITTEPEFTVGGTLGIVLGFALFAVMQSISALASQRPWRDWPRRGARLLGLMGMLPLMFAAGALMAPTIVLGGLALWHPQWPRPIRWVLGLLVLLNVAVVGEGIASDHGVSARTVLGVCGLLLIYSCIVWATAGTFAPPRRRVRES